MYTVSGLWWLTRRAHDSEAGNSVIVLSSISCRDQGTKGQTQQVEILKVIRLNKL